MKKLQATCAIVVNDNGEILLIKRWREPFAGHWALVSGIGETKKGLCPEKAVVGEVECDLQTLFIGKLLFSLPIQDDQYVYETVVFIGKVDESKIKINPPFSMEYKWFSPNEINSLGRLAYEHSDIISRYVKEKIVKKKSSTKEYLAQKF